MRRFLVTLTRSTAALLVFLMVSCGTSDEDLEDGPAGTGVDVMSAEPADTGVDMMSDGPADTVADVVSDALLDTGGNVMSDANVPDCGYIELEGDCGACVPMYAFEYTEEGGCIDFSGEDEVQLACVDRMTIANAAADCVVVDNRFFLRTTTIQQAVSESNDWRYCTGDEWNEAFCM